MNLYCLVGKIFTKIGKQVHITAIIPNTAITILPNGELMKTSEVVLNTIKSCLKVDDVSSFLTIIHEMTLSDYLSKSMTKMLLNINKKFYNQNDYLFDFIEYNGGISISPLYKEHLNLMQKVCTSL